MAGSYLDTQFEFVVEAVRCLNRGQRIFIDRSILPQRGGIIGDFLNQGATPADQVLERIIGSSYELRYQYSPDGSRIEFSRLHDELPNGVRSYVSMDRRHLFKQRFDNLWVLNNHCLNQEEEYKIECAKQGHRWHVAYLHSLPILSYVPVEMFLSEVDLTTSLRTGHRCILCGKEKI